MRRAFTSTLILFAAMLVVIVVSVWMRPHEIVPWRKDFVAASREAAQADKPMLLDFTATWCGPCQDMRRTTWSDREVATELRDYVPIQIDYDRHPELVSAFEVRGIPHVVLLTPAGRVIQARDGEMDPQFFRTWLETGTSGIAQERSAHAGN